MKRGKKIKKKIDRRTQAFDNMGNTDGRKRPGSRSGRK